MTEQPIKPQPRKPREMPTYVKYKGLIAQHKKIYEATGAKEKYEHKFWIDNDTSWRQLDHYVRVMILKNLEYKVLSGELSWTEFFPTVGRQDSTESCDICCAACPTSRI